MVWIHGGAFHFGSGSANTYGPDFLVKEDVVLVMMNYRLNVFGKRRFHKIKREKLKNKFFKNRLPVHR